MGESRIPGDGYVRFGGEHRETCYSNTARRPVFSLQKKYGGLGVSELRRLRQLEEENHQLKKLVADLSLDKQMLQEVIKKKL